jgi:HAD superfamily phosphatase (TIGR01681 family)
MEPGPSWQYGGLQSRLDALVASFAARLSSLAHIRLLSPSRLAALSPQRQRLDVKTLNQAGFPYTSPHMSWDLDHHAAQHGAYQQMLQSLADSGVLVAVASKNGPALVRSALERTDLLLRADSAIPVEAHWGPKSESVARILKAWNISAESVVFIDDSAVELAEVHNAYPTMQCRPFLEDPNQVAELLSELGDLFGKPFDSEEDLLRLKSLRAGAELRNGVRGAESLEREWRLPTKHPSAPPLR